MKTLRILFIAAAAMLLAACSTTLMTIKDQPVPGHKTTAKQVHDAIMQSGRTIGWHMKEVKSGVIGGAITVRGHSASVTIPYSSKSYSILYHSSHKLSYDASSNKISRFYNNWVVNLNNHILAYLNHMPTAPAKPMPPKAAGPIKPVAPVVKPKAVKKPVAPKPVAAPKPAKEPAASH